MTKPTGLEHNWQKQVQELQNELTQLKTNNQVIWGLLVQIGNRLQRSSTSIKTAVSSLLDFDIFWDETTEYEFLQAIDNSTNEMADLIVLMTLAFRSQAKTLEIEVEPNSLQEILVSLPKSINKNGREKELEVQYPAEGKPALVDYQYLSLALGLLIEVIFSEDKDATKLSIITRKSHDYWHLQIEHLAPSIVIIIRHFFEQANDIVTIANQILPEDALKLITACRILFLQNIQLCEKESASNPTVICLQIPTAVESPRNE
ncbi:MAG: hypothetical protein H6667_09250 [Ardenticatenaceae bacterium]|nr:hypothetical protein [Ardenticatenaceae bacterium]MCB9446035.1 hypothetical protein [Ardenticatenaceae bacterium]